MDRMETYDILMLVVLAGATLFGAIKGFAWQLASIASIIVSYLVAYHFREPFSESIKAEPPWNRFLAMLILYVGTSLVIWMAFRMVSRTIDRMRLKEFDRQIGALFGLAKGGLYCILITLFAVTLLGDRIREKIVGSKSGLYISKVLDKSQAVIPPELHEVVQPVLDKFDQRFNGSSDEGLAPLWPSSENAANSFTDAVWDRFGSSSNESQFQESASPWSGGQSAPIQSNPFQQSIDNGFQQFEQNMNQAQQTYRQGQQVYQQGQQTFQNASDQFNRNFGQ